MLSLGAVSRTGGLDDHDKGEDASHCRHRPMTGAGLTIVSSIVQPPPEWVVLERPWGGPNALFAPFFTIKPNGLGMGPAIYWSIVEQQGGGLTAANNVDSGATFRFGLPVAHHTESVAA